MPQVENVAVDMTFNNKQFEAGVQQSLGTLDKLKNALKFEDSGKNLDGLSKSINGIDVSRVVKNIDTIGKRASVLGIIGGTVINKLTSKVMSFGHKITSNITDPLIQGGKNRAMNIAQAEFQLDGLIHNEAKVKDLLKVVGDTVTGTAYGYDEAAKAAAQFYAAGVTGSDQMYSSLRAITGVAAMTNSSFDEIAGIFTTVSGNGRLMGDQLNQLSVRGLNAAATLSKELGKSETEIREMVRKGQISFDMFQKAMNHAFGDQAKKANDTFNGALSNMKAAFARIGADFATPAMKNLRDVFNAIRPLVNKVHEYLGPFIENVSKGMTFITKKAVALINKIDPKWITKAANTVENVLVGLAGIAVRVGKALMKILPKDLVKGFANLNTNLNKMSKKFRDTFSVWNTGSKKAGKVAKKTAMTLKDIDKLAHQVIDGKYGNGEKRKKELAKIGASYARVQNRVNELLGCSVRHKVEEDEVAKAQKKTKKTTDNMSEAMTELSKKNTKAATAIDNVAHILAGLYAAAKLAVSAVTTFMKIIGAPLLQFVVTNLLKIGALIGDKLVEINKAAEDTKAFERFFTFIRDTFLKIYGIIAKVLGPVISVAIFTLGLLFKTAITGFKAVGKIISVVVKAFEIVGGAISKVLAPISQFASGLIGAISEKVTTGFRKLPDLFEKLRTVISGLYKKAKPTLDKLSKVLEKLLSKAGKALKQLGQRVEDLSKKGISKLKDLFNDWIKPSFLESLKIVSEKLGKVRDRILAIIKKIKESAFVEKTVTRLKEAVSNLADRMHDLVEAAKKVRPLQLVAEGLATAFSFLSGVLKKVVDYIIDFAKTVKNMPGFVKLVNAMQDLGTWIKEIAKAGFDKFIEFFNKLKDAKFDTTKLEGLPKILDKVASILGDIIEFLLKGPKAAKDFIDSLSGRSGKNVDNLTTSVVGLSNAVDNVGEKSSKGFGALKKAFEKIGEYAHQAYENGKGIGKNLFSGLFDFIKTIDISKVIMAFKGAATILVLVRFANFIKTLDEGVQGLNKIPGAITKALGSLSDAVEAYKKKLGQDTFTVIAEGLIKIATAMLIVSGIPADQLANIAVAFAIILGVISLVIAALAKLSGSETTKVEETIKNTGEGIAKAIKDAASGITAAFTAFFTSIGKLLGKAAMLISIAAVFVAFSLSVLLLVQAIAMLAKMLSGSTWKQTINGLFGLVVVSGILVGVAVLMSKFAKSVRASMAKSFIGFGVAVLAMAKSVEIMSKIPEDALDRGLGAVFALGLLAASMGLVAKRSGSIAKMAVGTFLMAQALLALAIPIAIIGRMRPETVAQGVGSLLGALVGLAYLSSMAESWSKGTLGLLGIAYALTIMAVAFQVLAPVADTAAKSLAILAVAFIGFVAAAAVAQAMEGAITSLLLTLGEMVLIFDLVAVGMLAFGEGIKLFGQGMQEIAKGITDLADSIVDSSQKIVANRSVVGKGVTAIIGIVAEGLVKNSPKILEAAAKFFSAIGLGIGVATPYIVEGLSELFFGIVYFTLEAGKALCDIALYMIIDICNYISLAIINNCDAIYDALENVWLALEYIFISGLEHIWEYIVGFLGPAGDALKDIIPFDKAKEEIKSQLNDGADFIASSGYGKKVVDQINKNKEDAKNAATGTVGEVENAAATGMTGSLATELENTLGGGVDKGFNKSKEKATEGSNALFNTLWSQLTGKDYGSISKNVDDGLAGGMNFDSTKEMLKQAGIDLPEELTGAWEINSPSKLFMRIGGYAMEGLKNGISEKSEGIGSMLGRIARSLSANFKEQTGAMKEAGKSMLSGVSSGVVDAAKSLKTSVSKAASNASKGAKVDKSSYTSEGAGVTKSLKNGITSSGSSVSSAVTSVLSKARTAANAQKKGFTTVGTNMMTGLRSGVRNAASRVASAAAAVVRSAISAAKRASDSHSPSRKFMEIGGYWGQGLILGIRSYSTDVAKATGDVAQASIANARHTLSNIASMINEDIDESPVISPVLDLSDVAAGAGRISSMFGTQSIGVEANVGAINRMMSTRQNESANADLLSAINKLRNDLSGSRGDVYNINGITYDDGTNVHSAVETLIRAATIEGRA